MYQIGLLRAFCAISAAVALCAELALELSAKFSCIGTIKASAADTAFELPAAAMPLQGVAEIKTGIVAEIQALLAFQIALGALAVVKL